MTPSPITGHADTDLGVASLRVTLPATAVHVWRALTTGGHTSAWLGRLGSDPTGPGDTFDLWHDDDVRSRHSVRVWEPPHALAVSWDFPDERPSLVAFTLAEGDSGTTATLTVHHEGLEAPVLYAAGWHRHLQLLDAHLGGHDVPVGDRWAGYDELVEHYGRCRPPASAGA